MVVSTFLFLTMVSFRFCLARWFTWWLSYVCLILLIFEFCFVVLWFDFCSLFNLILNHIILCELSFVLLLCFVTWLLFCCFVTCEYNSLSKFKQIRSYVWILFNLVCVVSNFHVKWRRVMVGWKQRNLEKTWWSCCFQFSFVFGLKLHKIYVI